MKDEYILILGAGLMQRPAIESAKELGFKALVIDANEKACCVPYADVFAKVDLKDREGILELAKSYGDSLKAVFTAGTDFSASVSFVCERLGLVSHSFDAAMNASNKLLMRKCFKDNGIPSPDFFEVSESDLSDMAKFEEISFPKVVKPCDNMGARGCRLVRNAAEFMPALECAVRFSRTKKAIVEDYMEGMEFSIDALVQDGNVTVTGFADRHIFFEPYFIELGHTMPSSVDEKIKEETVAVFRKAVAALGLSDGVAKGDVKYTSKGPMIGEIAGRLSGGYMSGWTYPYASGINLTKEAMKISLGQKNPLASKTEVECVKFSHERAFISIPGTVAGVFGAEKIDALPFVRNIFFRVKPGDDVDFPRNNVEKCGNVISCSEKRELSLEGAERAVSEIVIRLEPNNRRTEDFLSGKELPDEKGFPYPMYPLSAADLAEFRKEISEIEKNKVVLKSFDDINSCLPQVLSGNSDKFRDYNYRSIDKSIALFKEVAVEPKEIPAHVFYSALVRGGIQGILYVHDSVE